MPHSLPATRPAATEERPSTLEERGFAPPFTAPMLLGSRVRQLPGEPRQLIIPGLAGRGSYVLGWDAIMSLALPTLHDEELWRQVAALPHLGPRAVRQAARRVAAAGFAGRAAMEAAAEAEAEAVEARRQAAAALAPRFRGRADPALLDRLAGLLAETGAEPGCGRPIRARRHALGRLAAGAPAAGQAASPAQEAARLLATGAAMVEAAIRALLQQLRQALDALPPALDAPDALAAVAEGVQRIEGLLDGWDHLVALVEVAGERSAARLREALIALPPIPLEAEGWAAELGAAEVVERDRRRLAPRPSWSAEARLDFIRDAEQARAQAS
jgi:hypothetical protein